MEELKKLRTTLDGLPYIASLLLVLLADVIYGALYRLTKGDTKGIVVAVIWFLTGGIFGIGYIIDIIHIITKKKITFLD